jgi:hypothetical protein
LGRDPNAETFVDSLEEFRSLVLAAFRQKLRFAAQEAEEAGWAVMGEFCVGAEHLSEPLLRIRYRCEPGKAARVVAVDGPGDCSGLFPKRNWAARLH